MHKRNNYLLYSLIISIIVLTVSCNNRNEQNNIIGKSICCDSLLLIKGKKSIDDVKTVSNGFSVFLWIDSTKCIPCEMNYLYGYELFSNRCDRITGHSGSMKVIISPAKAYDIDMIVNEVRGQNYSFDILVDYDNTFNPLFNCNNRILVIERNGVIMKSYYLDDRKRDQRAANECLKELEKLNLAQE